MRATWSEAPFCLDVFPEVETANFGANLRFAQLAAWNGLVTVALALLGFYTYPVIVAVVMLHPPSGLTSGMTTGSPFSEEETRVLAGVCDVG